MLGYMNAKSIRLSINTGEVHFWSRSRAEIWRKGATSGNTFQMVGIDHDCDADALLITVIPAGPACHTGTTSCFDSGAATGDISSNQSPVVLAELWRVIADRVSNPIEGSYTVDLLSRGSMGYLARSSRRRPRYCWPPAIIRTVNRPRPSTRSPQISCITCSSSWPNVVWTRPACTKC